MTDEKILALLNVQGGAGQEGIEKLSGADFDRVQQLLERKYAAHELVDCLHRVLEGQRRMAATAMDKKDADGQAFAAVSAAFYTMLASMPPDVFTFINLVMYRAGKNDLPECWQREFAGAGMVKAMLPALQAVRPANYVMQVDNVFRHLTELQAETSVYAGKKGKKEISTMVSLSLPRQYELEGQDGMDAYDKAVLNGVNSLIENGTENFTIPMLYHAMTGRENPTVDEGLLRELQSRIEMMRRTLITIDMREEVEAQYLDIGLTEPRVQGYLLPLNLISARINGRETRVYHFIDTPPMLAYARMKRQLATVPITLLAAPLNNNATTIPLKNYIIARCEGLRNGKNSIRSNKILFESIYAELGEQGANKVRKKRIRDYTEVILAHLVQQNYLRRYEMVKAGRTIEGVEVTLA